MRALDGELTPLTSACDCFVRGYAESIPIPSQPDAVFACSLPCVQSLLQLTTAHVAAENGPAGPTLACTAAMSALAASVYGNGGGYVAGGGDTDSLHTLPPDDPRVLRAAEAVRIAINARRLRDCPIVRPYNSPGRVVYARRGLAGGGRGEYRLEVVFAAAGAGGDTVLARVAHLPKSRQPVDPAAAAALDDVRNLDGRFELASAVPGPCDASVREQLAVSASGPDLEAADPSPGFLQLGCRVCRCPVRVPAPGPPPVLSSAPVVPLRVLLTRICPDPSESRSAARRHAHPESGRQARPGSISWACHGGRRSDRSTRGGGCATSA